MTLLTAVRAKAEQLAAQGIWPTGHRVMEGLPVRARYDRLRPEVNAILADVRQKAGIFRQPVRSEDLGKE